MRLTITPIKDATIYSQSVNLSTGVDEILEVGKGSMGNYPIRSLLQFDLSAFNMVPSSASFELQLFIANATNLNVTQSLVVSNVVSPWNEGTGYAGQDTFQLPDGVTWNSQPNTGSLNTITTATTPIKDMVFDVTSIVQAQLTGPSSGLMIQFPINDENNPLNKGNIKFFSKDTHTIYAPILVAKWNDQVYQTGSLSAYPQTNLLVTPATLKPTYTLGETVRVDFSVRPAIPTKTFGTQFTQYLGNSYLPTSSYYSIVDDYTGKVIVPFDDSSRISCDGTSSYCVFRVENMYPRRFYRLKVRVDHNGLSEIFDAGYIFKVTD
jgi:hypothetical protein